MKNTFLRIMQWAARQRSLQHFVAWYLFPIGGWLLLIPYELIGLHGLVLTFVGRKTGKRYKKPLLYVKQGNDYFVMAPFGGAEKRSQWYLNLKSAPRATIERFWRKRDVVAEEIVDETERVALIKRYPLGLLDGFEERTGTKIPVIRLRPI